MSRRDRGLERLLAATGPDLGDLVLDDLVPDDTLHDLVGRVDPAELRAMRGGARLRVRPLLVVLAARAAGAATVDAELQHAAEILHLALVVHDLTLGQPGGRRRRVARRVLRRLGGSHLTVRALELSRHVGSPDVLGEAVDALRAFSDGQGLARELADSGQPPRRSEVEDHADDHHGALYAFCCRAGAHVAGAPAPTVAALGRYGRHLGRLWTLADDQVALSGIDGSVHLAERAAAGRPVLAVAVAAERDPDLAAVWRPLVRRGQHAPRVLDRIRRVGALGASREAMAQASWAARQALRSLPASAYRDGMEALAEQLARIDRA